MKSSRRSFLTTAAAISTGFLGLRHLTLPARGQYISADRIPRPRSTQAYQSEVEVYGPLIPDPNQIFDLPKGFSYTIISQTGGTMTDGLRVPGEPDGMAAFEGPNGKIILIRNHELTSDMTFKGPFGAVNESYGDFDRARLYDAGEDLRPHLGGTTTLVYDPAIRKVEREFLSLGGTCRNCAGGPTPWNSWISCEENVDVSWEAERLRLTKNASDVEDGAGSDQNLLRNRKNFNEKNHGYNFEVPACDEPALAEPVPLKAMGRFYHEAVAVDPSSGIVYQTEDRDDSLIYRFIPHSPGKLACGGRLQALAIRDSKSADTRNWPETGKPKLPVNSPVSVEWIDLEDVESPLDDLRARGHNRGAARFARGEGMWYGREEVFFACTSGGISKTGQIFRYRPSPFEGTEREAREPGQLTLYLEPNNTHLIQACDNLAFTPWGHLLICEDGTKHNYLRGVTPEGKIYTIGDSAYFIRSELCGVCFAPNHPTLFVNIQRPGLTLAITGPWITEA